MSTSMIIVLYFICPLLLLLQSFKSYVNCCQGFAVQHVVVNIVIKAPTVHGLYSLNKHYAPPRGHRTGGGGGQWGHVPPPTLF